MHFLKFVFINVNIFHGISDKAKLFKAPESAGSVMEALNQRLAKYRESADQAKQEGNGSKARRMGRIAKVTYSPHRDKLRLKPRFVWI